LARNNQTGWKNARKLKKDQVRSDDDIFLKILAKCIYFEVSVSELFMKSRSRLEILTRYRSRSRKLRSRLPL